MSGWIADHRKELESDIWLMPPLYHRTWQWIKYKAYHDSCNIPNKDGTITHINPGQFPTSYRNIAKGIGYYEQRKWQEPNVKTVKSILDWLTQNKMITVYGNTLGTIVTVENWALYQEKNFNGNTKRIATETRMEHDLDTNNKIEQDLNNNNKKARKIFSPPTIEQVTLLVIEKEYVVDPKYFHDYYSAGNWTNNKGEKMKSWERTLMDWNKRDLEKNPNKPKHKPSSQAKEITPSTYKQPYNYED